MNAIDYAQKANELFTVPQTSNQLRQLYDKKHTTMEDIANVVYNDPSLTVHLLKYANSPIFRFERKIESLEKAVQVIGSKAVYEFSIAFSMANMFTKDTSKHIDVKRFWRQSILCALYAVFFAKKTKEKDISKMYTSGLLHNVGELAVLRIDPSVVRQCNDLNRLDLPKICQEEELGFSFADVSAALLQQWLIPDSLVSTIAMQHHDESPAMTKEAQIIQLSYSLAIANVYPQLYSIKKDVPSFLYTSLNIDSSALDEAIEDANEKFSALADIFNMTSAEAA